jgi:hypothetical protein
MQKKLKKRPYYENSLLFRCQREDFMKKIVLLLPFFPEISGFSGKEKELCEPVLEKVDCVHKFAAALAQVDVLWLSQDNHLTKDLLGEKPYKICELNQEGLSDYFLQNDIDLIIAEGHEILSFVDTASTPVLLHFGFLPETTQSGSLNAQRQKLQTFALSDFFICHAEAQLQYLEINRELFGLEKLNNLLAPPDAQSFLDLLENDGSLNDFLKNPVKVPRKPSLIAKITHDFTRKLDRQRQELTDQRESELEWLRKAFTQEIKTLMTENEQLKQQADRISQQTTANLKNESQFQEAEHKETSPRQETETVDHETPATETCCAQNEIMNNESSQETDTKEQKLIPFEIHQAEINSLQNHVQDLENRIQRYQGRWYYVLFFWFFDKLQVWLIRLPLVMLIYVYHLWVLLRQRFQSLKGPKSLMETQ